MKIIEQHIVGKTNMDLCEDGIVVTPDYVCVIDGSTSKSQLPPLPQGLTGGQLARFVVDRTLREIEADADVDTFCQRATEGIRALYPLFYGEEILPLIETHPENRFCCSAIIYSRYRDEIWMIGDCHALLVEAPSTDDRDTYLSNEKPSEALFAGKRSVFLKKALGEGLTVEEVMQNDPGRAHIIDELIAGMQQQNVSYAVLDGFPVAMQYVKVIAHPPKHPSQIILASDGYPKLFYNLVETERYLQHLIENDPLCIDLHLATKGLKTGACSFDDRSYVRFTV